MDARLRDVGIKQPQCKATIKSTGLQCKKSAVTGTTVCASHGGRAPQVKNAGLRRTQDLIEERLEKAWKVVDGALEDGDTNIAWKLIAAKASLDARAEETLKPKNVGEIAVLDEKGRQIDPAWSQYAIGTVSLS